MSFPQSVSVTVTTASDGSATAYSDPIRGSILSIRYVKTDFSDGVDFNITTETSAQTLWAQNDVNASATVYPKLLNDDTAGADLTGEYDHVRAFNERIKVVIASGGNAKSGTFEILYA